MTLSTAANSISASTVNFTMASTDFSFIKPSSLPWMYSQSTVSLVCASGGPFVTTPSSSIVIATDVIFSGTLMSNSATGLVKVNSVQTHMFFFDVGKRRLGSNCVVVLSRLPAVHCSYKTTQQRQCWIFMRPLPIHKGLMALHL